MTTKPHDTNHNSSSILTQSELCFSDALSCIPGGVNSPVRAFKSVGGNPIFIEKGQGAYLFDVDGNRYIDYVGAYGPLIAGHAHPSITAAIHEAAKKGAGYGAPTQAETQLCQTIIKLMPHMDQIRLVNSGTEATMSALRLARGFTGKSKIIKFIGCYHGHHDSLLIDAGSGALTHGHPSSAGVTPSQISDTLLAHYNDLEAVKALFEAHQNTIAAVIVEPVAGNMNLVPPNPEFLHGLRHLCDAHQSLLIFDEVMTGFRVGLHSASGLFAITPDITCLGKVIGAGLPIGAYGARHEIMQHLAPEGPVYQAGTCSGNPIAVAAGLAQMEIIQEPDFYVNLTKKNNLLMNGLQQLSEKYNIPFRTKAIGGMFGFGFYDQHKPWLSLKDVNQSNTAAFAQFFKAMLKNGINLAPSAFEAGFISSAHSKADIEQTLKAAENAFETIM
jgi:glutamate-1-semialdehyde 2,1-aminomutase